MSDHDASADPSTRSIASIRTSSAPVFGSTFTQSTFTAGSWTVTSTGDPRVSRLPGDAGDLDEIPAGRAGCIRPGRDVGRSLQRNGESGPARNGSQCHDREGQRHQTRRRRRNHRATTGASPLRYASPRRRAPRQRNNNAARVAASDSPPRRRPPIEDNGVVSAVVIRAVARSWPR